jgi:FAD/FMN-containing dehydrogenase
VPIPPGLDDKTFQRALTRFKAVVGDAWVFTSAENLALYEDAHSPLWNEQDEKVASAAVAPDSAEQVREIVKIANELRVPLYPISPGRNLGYGGAAPAPSGSDARLGSKPTNARSVQAAREGGRRARWGEYRTHTAFMDDCAAAYSFNDRSLRKLHETIKDAVDPNGILSAGRYGIWPKHLRKA